MKNAFCVALLTSVSLIGCIDLGGVPEKHSSNEIDGGNETDTTQNTGTHTDTTGLDDTITSPDPTDTDATTDDTEKEIDTGENNVCAGVSCYQPPLPTCRQDADEFIETSSPIGYCVDGNCAYAKKEEKCDSGKCDHNTCVQNPCQGIICSSPPISVCSDDKLSLIVFSPLGHCSAESQIHKCSYSSQKIDCPTECNDGVCLDEPCMGLRCIKPPARHCNNEHTVSVFDTKGNCLNGECNYTIQHVDCSGSCDSGQCTEDPCTGITCYLTPASYCVDSSTIRDFESLGACDNGSCYYDYVDRSCLGRCFEGICVDDPCIGVDCSFPPADYCNGNELVEHEQRGTCHELLGCQYEVNREICDYLCESAVCVTNPNSDTDDTETQDTETDTETVDTQTEDTDTQDTETDTETVDTQTEDTDTQDSDTETFVSLSCADGYGRLDTDSNICWQHPKTEGTFKWQQVKNYCNSLVRGDYDDWRLPTRQEFVDLLGGCDESVLGGGEGFCNTCAESEKCNELFNAGDTQEAWYWSSTEADCGSKNTCGWSASFDSGSISYGFEDFDFVARCIHSIP